MTIRRMGVVHATSYPMLGYQLVAPGMWRFVDRETGQHFGREYPTKAELIGNVERMAQQIGVADPGPPTAEMSDQAATRLWLERLGLRWAEVVEGDVVRYQVTIHPDNPSVLGATTHASVSWYFDAATGAYRAMVLGQVP